ncbi:hypothetical protein N752_11560 [Desulforamulus aquiferis]|nr:Ig-like domain-containing protein [Desulforamulus aquiferis]RYD04994.1 hypothetical protein N752_11560 [Desulforamulus aquiferis]
MVVKHSDTQINTIYSSMLLGESKKLSSTIQTGQGIVWTSANNSVARVDQSGVVTGTGYGYTFLLASSPDGKYMTLYDVLVANYNVPNYGYLKQNVW